MVLIMTASPFALRAECGSGYYSIFIFEGTGRVINHSATLDLKCATSKYATKRFVSDTELDSQPNITPLNPVLDRLFRYRRVHCLQ